MKLSRYFLSLAAGLLLCLGLGALSANAFATTWTVSTSASPAAGGTVCCEFTGSSAYINDFTVSAHANPGYRFTNWTENGVVVSTSANYGFESRAARTLVANFVADSTTQTSRLIVIASPAAGGTVCCEFTFTSAIDSFMVGVFANPGYRFTNWTENGVVVSTSAGYAYTADVPTTLVANFVAESIISTTAVARITANQTSFVANSTDVLSLSGTIQAGNAAGIASDIYVQANVSSGDYGRFYLGANLGWSAAAAPIVSGFRLADVNAPNFYGIAIAGLPAATYTFSVIVVRSGAGPNSSADTLALASTAITISAATATPAPAPAPAPTPTPTPDPTLTAAPCTYWISPTSQTFDASGGYGTVNVRQNQTSCLVPNPPWAVRSNASWITNAYAGSLSNGQGPAYYYVQPNSGSSSRTGTITVADNTHTVTQSAGTNPFQGTFRGTWRGSCTLYGSVSGSFTMSIASSGSVSGTFTGDDYGSFSGSIGLDGGLTASGSAGVGGYWTGQFAVGGGGTGSWTLPGCSGSWSTS